MATIEMLDPLDAEIINATVKIAVAAGVTFGAVAIECVMHWDRDYAMIRDFRLANLCYFAARYIGVATMATYLALDSIGTQRSGCELTFKLGQILSAFLFLSCASIFAMRVAALYNNSLWVMMPLAGYALAIVAYTIYAALNYLTSTQSPFGILICNCDIVNRNLGLVYLLNGSFDVIILVLTLAALFRRVPFGSRLRTLLVGDQVLYVLAVSLIYFVAGICYYQASKISQFIVSLVVLSLSSILVCRLFLRLRDFGGQSATAANRANTPIVPQQRTTSPLSHRRGSSLDAFGITNSSVRITSERIISSPPPSLKAGSDSTFSSPAMAQHTHFPHDEPFIITNGSKQKRVDSIV